MRRTYTMISPLHIEFQKCKSQNKQHSQYKIHHLFSPCKPPACSKTTTHHSNNVDTLFYNLRELRSRFYSPLSNPTVCPRKEVKLQTSCHSYKSKVTIYKYRNNCFTNWFLLSQDNYL